MVRRSAACVEVTAHKSAYVADCMRDEQSQLEHDIRQCLSEAVNKVESGLSSASTVTVSD
jgi:hypothetical protein